MERRCADASSRRPRRLHVVEDDQATLLVVVKVIRLHSRVMESQNSSGGDVFPKLLQRVYLGAGHLARLSITLLAAEHLASNAQQVPSASYRRLDTASESGERATPRIRLHARARERGRIGLTDRLHQASRAA
jgi:hypothetical protein